MTVLVTTMYLKGGSEKEWLCYLCNHVKEASALLASSSKVNEEKNVRMCHTTRQNTTRLIITRRHTNQGAVSDITLDNGRMNGSRHLLCGSHLQKFFDIDPKYLKRKFPGSASCC